MTKAFMDPTRQMLARYRLTISTADGQLFLDQMIWIPEQVGSQVSWAEFFRGDMPIGEIREIRIPLIPDDPSSPFIRITRD